MTQSAAAIVGPCLEKICHAASGRKYAKLQQDAQVRAAGSDCRRPTALLWTGPRMPGSSASQLPTPQRRSSAEPCLP